MRISRLNYDKVWRCPSWSGGGWTRGDDAGTCSASFASFYFERSHPRWRFTRCPECGVICLPDVTRWADPTYLWWYFGQRRRIYNRF